MGVMGRPTVRTEAIVDEIIDRVTAGEPLAQVLRSSDAMPSPSAFYVWLNEDAELDGRFARAREHGHDAIAADCLRIADTPMPGVIQKKELLGVLQREGADGQTERVALPEAELVVTEERVEDMLGHRKLQVETRLKLLSKWDRRYADRQQIEHTGKLGLEQLVAGEDPKK
jgi:hypothetical protein